VWLGPLKGISTKFMNVPVEDQSEEQGVEIEEL
jgi:hypothetical protein